MIKVKCIGCERILEVKQLEAFSGFAACPECHALFDVTRDVVKRSPKGVAEFWSHGELSKPPGVEVIEQQVQETRPNDAYRGNARAKNDQESITLTCSNQKLFVCRIVGPMMIVMFGAAFFGLRQLDPSVDTSVAIPVAILTGLPVIAGFYLVLVGYLNRVRIHLDRSRLRVDLGPVPFPHEKIELSSSSILRLCAHQSTWTGRNSVKKTDYSLAAWLPAGRRTTFLDSLTDLATVMFLQRRMAMFLGLQSSAPVDLVKESSGGRTVTRGCPSGC